MTTSRRAWGRWGPGGGRRGGKPASRAFTLIEILIAVLILALGVLGLGAIFPAVIREQRLGTEAIQGVLAASTAERILTNYNYARAMQPWVDPGPSAAPPCRVDGRNFWRDWRDGAIALGGLNHQQFENGKWLIPDIDGTTYEVVLGYRGAYVPPAGCAVNPNMTSDVRIPLSQRLYPAGSPVDNPPQYVWDLAVHRLPDFIGTSVAPTNDATRDPLQVVIFVRRIDSRIRLQPGTSLYRALTTGGIVPVGSMSGSDLPSGDGTGEYSVPIKLIAEYRYDGPGGSYPDRNRLYLPGVSAEHWLIARQLGQKLVDNLGGIHTVVSYGEDGGRYVRVDPPVSDSSEPSNGTIIEVVCTPQVPAAVAILRVDP